MTPRLSWLVLTLAFTLATQAQAGEKLPPEAYLNRTIYPAIIDYAGSTRGYPELAIGILSDIQYADKKEKNRRHFKLSLEKLEHAVREFNVNRTHLDLVMHLGDLVDEDMNKYLPVLQPVLDKLKYPLYQVLGNHDFLGIPESDFAALHKKLKMPGRYYSVSAGPSKKYRLLMLDGNDLSLYSTREGTPERKEAESILQTLRARRAKNAKPFNGALSGGQLTWLKQQLGEACDAGQQALIFLHHPMRPKDEPTNLWNDITAVPIITGFHCAAAVINGHAHKLLYDFHYTKYRHVHFITFGGMVQSPFTSFGFVDVYSDLLHVHGLVFGREIDLKLGIAYHANADLPSQRNSVVVDKAAPVVTSDGSLVETTQRAVRLAVTDALPLALKGPSSEGVSVQNEMRMASMLATITVIVILFTVYRFASRR